MQQCLQKQNKPLYSIDTTKRLGRGAYGEVFVFCTDPTECRRNVAKVVQYGLRKNMAQQFEAEAQMAEHLGAAGFGPAVVFWSSCPEEKVGLLVMRRLDLTLEQYLVEQPSRYTPELMATLHKRIDALARAGFYNEDLHTDNIMLTRNPLFFYFIDFGLASRIPAGMDWRPYAERMKRRLQSSLDSHTLPLIQRLKRRTPPDSTVSQSKRRRTQTVIDTDNDD